MIDDTIDPQDIDEDEPSAFEQRQSKDLELYHQWKDTGSKKHLGALINQLNPIIYKEVHRQSGTLPASALSGEAKTWAIKAIQSYDPTKGVQLATHVTNYIQRVRRMNYKYQNSARLPENKQRQYGEFNSARAELETRLNREPTDDELAKHLGWSKGATVKFKNSLYSELVESASDRPAEFSQFSDNAINMEYIKNNLSPDELFILEHVKEMSVADMCKALNINTNRYNYLKKKTSTRVEELMKEVGYGR